MVVIKRNVIYDAKHQLASDIYYPNNTSSQTKILIFWHGGGWFRGDKESLKGLGVTLANAGFMTFVPNYRLAPKSTFPAAHKDSLTFVKWLLASRYTDADDQKNIVQIGASSGGTLAIYDAGQYGFPTVTWSAPLDFSHWWQAYQKVKPTPDAEKDLGLTDRRAINAAFYKYFSLTYAGQASIKTFQKMDVQNYNLTHLHQLMMINSADELTPLTDVLNFVHFLAKHNHAVQLLVIKGHGHAMDYGQDYVDESIDFLFQTIKRENKDQ